MSHTRPSLSVATHHRQPFYDLVPRDPERQAPLSNNAQIRVAPGESTPNPQAGRALGSDSSVSTGLGYQDTTYGVGPSPVKGGPTGKLCPAGPHWLKTNLSGAQRQMKAGLTNGKSAWATTRNV